MRTYLEVLKELHKKYIERGGSPRGDEYKYVIRSEKIKVIKNAL